MANIYEEKNEPLHQLLERARSGDGATVLIPDLQRPYVWTPTQVILLVDSLIRGWPFGTLLMWKIGRGELEGIPHRPFWQVADRTEGSEGTTVARKDPPSDYHMVLDGQQRVQSLLLALGGDSWGFKMDDRDWAEELHGRRIRGRRGKYTHWSKASLCFDLQQFLEEYSVGELRTVDFRNVLQWVVTDPAEGQSKWTRPDSYDHPLKLAADKNYQGRYIRLSRIWNEATPNPAIKESGFREIVRKLFGGEGISPEVTEKALNPMGELMTTLRDLKLSKVTYLELRAFDSNVWKQDEYNDAIVNIFTRLNTAGRTLTREEITMAWLKVGWDPEKKRTKTAGECFEELLKKLVEMELYLSIDELVGAVSVIWAIGHNDGKLLENSDLLKGAVVRPMAGTLAEEWDQVVEAITTSTEAVRLRGLSYGAGGNYSSLNSLAILWAWQFLAINWEKAHPLREVPRDAYRKKCQEALNEHLDRWLICSQWAGRWNDSKNMAGYAKDLAVDVPGLKAESDPDQAVSTLKARLAGFIAATVADAVQHVETLSTLTRERVSVYRNILWVWHRLEDQRWEKSQIQLRTGRARTAKLEVDHTVAHAFWEKQISGALPTGIEEKEEALTVVNRLGNCALLEKSFNISKSDKPLKTFMDEVHEIKDGKVSLDAWSNALSISPPLLDPSAVPVDAIVTAIAEREKAIRSEVVEFVKGTRKRVDVDR